MCEMIRRRCDVDQPWSEAVIMNKTEAPTKGLGKLLIFSWSAGVKILGKHWRGKCDLHLCLPEEYFEDARAHLVDVFSDWSSAWHQ